MPTGLVAPPYQAKLHPGAATTTSAVKRFAPLLVSFGALALVAVYVANGSKLRSVEAAIQDLNWPTGAAVFCLFVVGSLLSSLRLWLIARDIRSPISGRDAVAALSAGSLAGAFFFQLAGQMIVRSTLLARRGTPLAATLIISGYERAAALFVSLAFAFAGVSFLFGTLHLDLRQGGAQLLKLLGVGFSAICAGAYFAWGRFVANRLQEIWRPELFGRAARSLAISVAIQLCTIAAYLVAAHELAPNIRIVDVAAASAIVMLAASLPISLAGWGIRELSAILALGAIGMPSEKALVVALLVGTLSFAALTFLLVASFMPGTKWVQKARYAPTFERPDFTTALAWVLPLATATTV